MTGLVSAADNLSGKLVLPDGKESTFNATKTSAFEEKKKEDDKDSSKPELVAVTYPNVGFGLYRKTEIGEHFL